MDNKLQNAKDILYNLTFDEIKDLLPDILPDILKDLNYENKKEIMTDILCDEWYLNTHYEFIKSILDIFAKSLN